MIPMMLDGKMGFGCKLPNTEEEWRQETIRESEYLEEVKKHFENCKGCYECGRENKVVV